VSHSEAGSETDPTPSDLESFGYQSSHGPSPALSLASLTGGNLYSSNLLSPQPLRAYPGGSAHLQRLSSPRPLSTPSTSPRQGISLGKRGQAPRPVSLPSFPLQIPSSRSSPVYICCFYLQRRFPDSQRYPCNLYLVKNVEDIDVFLFLKVFNYDHFYMFTSSRICK